MPLYVLLLALLLPYPTTLIYLWAGMPEKVAIWTMWGTMMLVGGWTAWLQRRRS